MAPAPEAGTSAQPQPAPEPEPPTQEELLQAMVDTMTVLPKNMAKAASGGFINATDCADYLVKKGMPFRDAYMVVGRLVNACIQMGETLDTLALKDFRAISDKFEADIYQALELKTCVNERKVPGGPSEQAVEQQIAYIQRFLAEHQP